MDLKSFREDKLKITQSAFAELIGVEQSSISRWEKDPDSISLPVIQKILEKTGVSYEELTGWEKPIPKPLDVNNTWEKANFTKCTLSDYISAALGDKNLPDERLTQLLCYNSHLAEFQKSVEYRHRRQLFSKTGSNSRHSTCAHPTGFLLQLD